MRFNLKKMIIVVCLLVLAAALWWPLIKWNYSFEAAPKVEFNVPTFTPLQFS